MTRALCFALAALAGCANSSFYAPRQFPRGLVVSTRGDPGPIEALTLILEDRSRISITRLIADHERLVVETTDGKIGRVRLDRVRFIEIRRSSGGLTVLAVAGVAAAGLLGLGLLALMVAG